MFNGLRDRDGASIAQRVACHTLDTRARFHYSRWHAPNSARQSRSQPTAYPTSEAQPQQCAAAMLVVTVGNGVRQRCRALRTHVVVCPAAQAEKPTVVTAHAHGSRRYDSTRAPLMSTKSISLTRSSAWATLTVSASSVTAAATSQHGQLCDGSQLPNTRIAAVTYACCAGTANRY